MSDMLQPWECQTYDGVYQAYRPSGIQRNRNSRLLDASSITIPTQTQAQVESHERARKRPQTPTSLVVGHREAS